MVFFLGKSNLSVSQKEEGESGGRGVGAEWLGEGTDSEPLWSMKVEE